MIRAFEQKDIDIILRIWLETNLSAHTFIADNYWKEKIDEVRSGFNSAEIYVYEDEGIIFGFIGILDNYIAGIFVDAENQSKGIGKQLLDYVKKLKEELTLTVYKKNTNAINFYQREAFIVNETAVDEDTNEEEYFMVWKSKN